MPFLSDGMAFYSKYSAASHMQCELRGIRCESHPSTGGPFHDDALPVLVMGLAVGDRFAKVFTPVSSEYQGRGARHRALKKTAIGVP